ncbi:MAG: protein kinase [Pirellulaceae bacterium]
MKKEFHSNTFRRLDARENCRPGRIISIRKRRYRFVEELGVWYRPRYRVFDLSSRRTRLLLQLNKNDVSQQHLQVLQRLPQCHGLPEILDFEHQSDALWVVTTWLNGIDLEHYLELVRTGRTVAPSSYESVRLVRGLAHGLLRLHQHAQLIHGDIKPKNLILSRKPAHLAMIDFGSAWKIADTATRLEGDGSQPVYAAPELLNGDERIDSRVDQFSATCVLYQLLTGGVPYDGLGGQAGRLEFRDQIDMRISIASSAVQRLPRAIRQQVKDVVVRGLQLDPNERFPTSNAWVDALETVYLELRRHQTTDLTSTWERWMDRLSAAYGWLSRKESP